LLAAPAAGTSFDSPTSVSLASPSASIRMLEGLMSRWITAWVWRE
jgi:hypothetical protein